MKLSTLILICFLLTGVKAQTMYVFEKTGSKTSFRLTDVRTISFSGGNMNVNIKDGSSTSKAISNIKLVSFTPITGFISPKSEETKAFMFYPNPVQDVLNVTYQGFTNNTPIHLEIMTIDGRVIYAESYESLQNERHLINVSSWQHGLYLIRINNGSELITKKFLKN